jgi:predicted transposase YbfD/YdcC
MKASNRQCNLSSKDLLIAELAKIIRKHRQIENNLHWELDMYFYEDLSRTSKDNALENLSLLRKLCYNIIKLDTRYDVHGKKKLSIKRKINRYNLNPTEFEDLLKSVIPQIQK